MGIYERVTANDPDGGGPVKISVHRLGAALREVARGNLTLAQVNTAFNLDATEQTEISDIAAKYAALTTDLDRSKFLGLLEDALLLAETGDYNKATVKSRLGF